MKTAYDVIEDIRKFTGYGLIVTIPINGRYVYIESISPDNATMTASGGKVLFTSMLKNVTVNNIGIWEQTEQPSEWYEDEDL